MLQWLINLPFTNINTRALAGAGSRLISPTSVSEIHRCIFIMQTQNLCKHAAGEIRRYE